MKNLLRALQYFRPERARMAVVFLLLLGGIGANLLKPWPLAFIVDSVLSDQKPLPAWIASLAGGWDKPGLLAGFGLAILALHLLQGGFTAAHNFLSIRIGLGGLTRVRNELFGWLQRLSLRFHHGNRAGDLIHRAAWDTYAFQTLFQQGLITFATALLSLLLMLAVMAQINVLLTALALAIVPLLIIAIQQFGRRMTDRSLKAQQADSLVTSHVQQSILALPLIQSYTREGQEQAHFNQLTGQAQARRAAQHGWEVSYALVITAIFGLGAAALTWLGARQVLAGELTLGQLLVFLTYLAQLYEPLNQLTYVGATVSTATAGTRRVFEILDTPEEVKDAPGARPVIGSEGKAGPEAVIARGNLEFENVSFHYVAGRDVLREVSFRLAAGESAALIGPSGVGKTTLLNLVPRFFDPTAGTVRLEGVDLRQLRLPDLRSQVALVLQEPLLLPATIHENIAYGRPAATDAEIEAAARAANADQFIRQLPNRYETVVGEGAARLSAGEKQRLNLARAFLKDAPILLLDEPTSALDAESELLVMESLKQLMTGRTTLIVAHRLSTIRSVNTVLVLQEGRLTESGTPQELLAQDGYFARVLTGQQPRPSEI